MTSGWNSFLAESFSSCYCCSCSPFPLAASSPGSFLPSFFLSFFLSSLPSDGCEEEAEEESKKMFCSSTLAFRFPHPFRSFFLSLQQQHFFFFFLERIVDRIFLNNCNTSNFPSSHIDTDCVALHCCIALYHFSWGRFTYLAYLRIVMKNSSNLIYAETLFSPLFLSRNISTFSSFIGFLASIKEQSERPRFSPAYSHDDEVNF